MKKLLRQTASGKATLRGVRENFIEQRNWGREFPQAVIESYCYLIIIVSLSGVPYV